MSQREGYSHKNQILAEQHKLCATAANKMETWRAAKKTARTGNARYTCEECTSGRLGWLQKTQDTARVGTSKAWRTAGTPQTSSDHQE